MSNENRKRFEKALGKKKVESRRNLRLSGVPEPLIITMATGKKHERRA